MDLPKAASSALKAADREPIIVSVNRDGEYFLNIDAHPESVIQPHELMVRVAAELELAHQSGQALNVLVKGDQGVAYGKVVTAMSVLKQAGAAQVGLLTDSSDNAAEDRG